MDSAIILNTLDALDRIDTRAVAKLILAYQNNDGGFWDPNYPEFAQQSTVQATSFALRALRHLNELNTDTIDNEAQEKINQFIQNSWSKESRTFSPFPGHPAISSYDAFRAWISVFYLPINQDRPEKIASLLHLEELIGTLNSKFLTKEKVYSESGDSEKSSLKASHLITWMMVTMDKTDKLPSWEITQFIRNYQDPRQSFSSDIYSIYSAISTLNLLAPTRMSGQVLMYQLLAYVGIIITLLSLLTFFAIQRKLQSKRRSALEHKAQTDRLTGLHNREFLEQRYLNYQHTNSHIALLLLDVDYFKSINDNYGHLAGDEVLIELSELLSDNIRKTDTLARWGGEEFAILCSATEPEQSKVFSEKLRVLIAEHKFSSIPKLTCSIGVSCSTHNEPLNSLFARADKALYQSKRNGRNQVTYL
jgi:diguanylate cyclase (GGDEF)-like protein